MHSADMECHTDMHPKEGPEAKAGTGADLGELSALLSRSYRAADWPVPPGFSMAYKPEGVLMGAGGVNHMLLRWAGGAVWGTMGCCCPGPLPASLNASGLMDAGGEACSQHSHCNLMC